MKYKVGDIVYYVRQRTTNGSWTRRVMKITHIDGGIYHYDPVLMQGHYDLNCLRFWEDSPVYLRGVVLWNDNE